MRDPKWWCCSADFGSHETTCPNFEDRREGQRRKGWMPAVNETRRTWWDRTGTDRRTDHPIGSDER